MILFLSLDDILQIHQDRILSEGGSGGRIPNDSVRRNSPPRQE